ncbi:putative CCR4-associated factor 1-like protein 11 [Gossypium australe]|uniref:poly(A)-specific ribonuclease n=1 Tax=Gossypium australe TaxID=47621 RepID=A0A5B6V6R4_9ROSI|nr:putative CCR4-associated factor 1-like protein 11 [Gossypium australe]
MSIFVNKPVIVREVFADNLEYEFMLIRSALHKYSFVSMDTEFPGTIFKPEKKFVQLGNPEVNYRFMKVNVDAMKIIQLGLTLSDSEGNLPNFGTPFCYIWEFNFKDFDIRKDHYDKESIKLLRQQGINFTKNKEKGICSRDFGVMFLTSGLSFGELTWVTFHSGYDFGFLLKILTQHPLPPDLKSFMRHLTYYVGRRIFDIKYSFKIFNLHGGLEKVAETLNVARVTGLSHQAGSDSLLILRCFMQIKDTKAFKECNQKLAFTAMAVARCQDYYFHGGLYVPPPRKVTYLHFFLHDTMSGNNPSAVPIVIPNITTSTGFGGVIAFDDPLTVGPDITSEVIGNAQGLWVSTGKDVLTLMVYLDIGFTKGEFTGSSISVLSRNPITESERELTVVGGKGKFRMAKGYAQLKTYSVNFKTGDAIVEYNVTKFVQLGNPEVNYRFMKVNVDAMKIIQLGLTLSDSEGNLPDFGTPFCYIWEFNFKDFDIGKDHYDKESIKLLRQQGINFTKNKEKGICSRDFGVMFLIFGLGFGELTWVTFHSSYDFDFLLKILTQHPLPPDLKSFMRHLTYYFGRKIFDIKYSFKIFNLHGGLEKVAETLNVARVTGLSHQAGSDSLLILRCFMQIKDTKAFKECNQNTAMAVARCQDYYFHGGLYVPPPRKVTYLHFFLHDTMSGNNPSAVPIVSPNITTSTGFGGVIAFDDPLTVGPDITSEVIGNAQGLWVSTGKDVLTLMAYLDIGFTKGEFNGSSISVLSRNPITESERELAVVGGKGKFRMAKGYAQLKTYSVNFKTGDAIVEYNVTRTLILCWFLILCIPMAYGGYYSKIELRVSNLRKVTNLRFFFHGILGGENTTAVTVARANSSLLGPSNSIVVDHAPLTVGPEPTSKNIGNAQGFKVFAGRDTTTVVYLDFRFIEGELNGNSISVFSRKSGDGDKT